MQNETAEQIVFQTQLGAKLALPKRLIIPLETVTMTSDVQLMGDASTDSLQNWEFGGCVL